MQAIIISVVLIGVPSLFFYLRAKARAARRAKLFATPPPESWFPIIGKNLPVYGKLSDDLKQQLHAYMQVFLGEKRITGIKLELDTTTLVLTGASAIIPIFGFPDWEWDQISEVLVYPDRFDQDFAFESGDQRHTLGMVGTGAMNRLMILSKPDLLGGFRNPGDKRNVGFHEFAHLVDKSDGTIDGLPAVGLERATIGPWIELVRRKMDEIRRGDSDIDPYGLTNEAEFFAVATEYFFERPGVMQRKHPELHAMLSRAFNQNLAERAAALTRELARGRPRFGRNSPCPCGSGAKYKKCCLE